MSPTAAGPAIALDSARPLCCYRGMKARKARLRHIVETSLSCVPRLTPAAALIAALAVAWMPTHCKGASHIFVVNHADGTISKHDDTGAMINSAFITGLRAPTGLAIANGYIYVANDNRAVRKYTVDGTLVNAELIGGLLLPWGIAISSNHLYVVNGGCESCAIGKYTTDGAPINTALVTGLGNPTGLAVDGGYLYVSEWHNGRFGKYTVDGATVNRAFIGGFFNPAAVVTDGLGNLYVSSADGGVRRYQTQGGGGALIVPPVYNSAIGLALDGNGYLYFASNYGGPGGNRIAKYTIAGQLISSTFITGLRNPVAMAILPAPATNRAPIANAGPDQVVECSGATAITLSGVLSSDPDGDVIQYQWTEGTTVLGTEATVNATLSPGTHTIRLVVTDTAGNTDEDTVQITIADTTPPQFIELVASPAMLWPPNQAMIPVTINATLADACDSNATARIISVTSSEPVGRRGDWEVTGPLTLKMRADRLGSGAGRTYQIIIAAWDGTGNRSTNVVTVIVPKSRAMLRR